MIELRCYSPDSASTPGGVVAAPAIVDMAAGLPSGWSNVAIAPGDHICAFFRGNAQREDILVPYLREAIASGDKCICVLDDPDTTKVLEPLNAMLGEPCDKVSQFDLLCSMATYLADGYFEPQEMIGFWDRRMSSAVHGEGYGFVRAVGEMTWALRDMPGVDQLLVYESQLNNFLPRYPQVILCLYDLDHFIDGRILLDLLRTHSKVLLSGELLDNPWHIKPETFLTMRR
jgi:hypothetical protein